MQNLKATALEYLEKSAGTDSLQDRYYVGFIAGLNSVLNMQVDELSEEVPEDDR